MKQQAIKPKRYRIHFVFSIGMSWGAELEAKDPKRVVTVEVGDYLIYDVYLAWLA